MVKKDKHYNIKIRNMASKGEGVGTVDGFAIFVKDVIVDEEVEVRITKVNKSFALAELVNILESSPKRVTPICKHNDKCGGCNMQHLEYSGQIIEKFRKVRSALMRIGGFKKEDEEGNFYPSIKINKIIGMEEPYYYRNKVQFPVGAGKNGEIVIGFYEENSHNIVPIEKCIAQDQCHIQILDCIKKYMKENNVKPYNLKDHKGIIRHIVIRKSFTTGEIMVCIVVNKDNLPSTDKLISTLSAIDKVVSIAVNINNNRNSIVLWDKTKILAGREYITEKIGHCVFDISPTSFFQINTIQTKVLYDTVLEFLKYAEEENKNIKDYVVVDAYCGIGTIALYIAKYVNKVIGIETVTKAIEDAEHNMELNNIPNVEFIEGQAEKILCELHDSSKLNADVVIVDPPRKGCDIKLIETILEMQPKKVIYVSCDPATLARDLKILCEDVYNVVEVQPIDLFPMTYHVETVALLSRIK